MSDSFYQGLRDRTAGPLIEKYGMALTLRRVTHGTYNPNTGTMGADTTVNYPCYGLVEEFDNYIISKSLVKCGDKKLLLSAKGLSVTPQIGDFIVFPDSTIWYIPEGGGLETSSFQPVQILAPGGIPVIFTLQVRL